MSSFVNKFTRSLSMAIGIMLVLSSICSLFGQAGTDLIRGGFFGFILNVFSGPVLVLFPTFASLAGDILGVYIIIVLYFSLGTLLIVFNCLAKKQEKFELSCFICACVLLFFVIFSVVAMIFWGVSILTSAGVWCSILCFLFLIFSICLFVLETLNMKEKQKIE